MRDDIEIEPPAAVIARSVSDEAIQSRNKLDCFVSLAMTQIGQYADYFVFLNTSSVLNSPTRFTGARFSHFCTSGSPLFQAIEPM